MSKPTLALKNRMSHSPCGGQALLLASFGVLVTAISGHAQISLPPAGESGIVEKSLRQSQPEFRPPLEKLPEIVIEDSRSVEDPGAGPTFVVKRIELEGNTLFSEEDLAPFIDIGDSLKVTLGILNLMANEITHHYAKAGYILTRTFIPAQRIENGVVKILVVEGTLGDIAVIGNERISTEAILDRMQPVRDEKILREQTLTRVLLQMNDALGFEVKSVLKPGSRVGTTDMALKVKETRPYAISLDADNFGSRFTGKLRMGVTAKVGNIFALGDRLSMRAVKSNEDQLFLNLSFDYPINNYGTRVGLSFIYSDFTLGESLAPLQAGGDSALYTLHVTHPFYRSRSAEFYLTLGGEYREFRNSDLFGPTSGDQLADVFLTAGGLFTDAFQARTYYALRLQQGFTEGDLSDPLNSRNLGSGEVLIASLSIKRYQKAFIGKSYFIIRGNFQWANDRVLSADQFAIGGFGTVRGYPLAEFAEDNGLAVSLEYVVPFPFKVALTDNPKMKTLDQLVSFFGFIDHARVYAIDPQPGEVNRDITGVGFGIRVNIPPWSPATPAFSLTTSIGFPEFIKTEPSDGSAHTFYLGGMISY